MSLSLHDLLSTGLQFLGVWFITRLKSNLRTALTTENKKNYIDVHAQNTTAFKFNTF